MKYLCLHTHKPCTPMQTYVCKYICMFTYECVCAISKLLQQLVHLDSVAADTASCCMLHSVCMSLCVCMFFKQNLLIFIVCLLSIVGRHRCRCRSQLKSQLLLRSRQQQKRKKIADAAGAFFCCSSRTQTFPADTYKHTDTHTHACMHTCMFVCTCST